VKSRFFEYSIIRNSRSFEPKVISLGFASVKHCNFTLRFFKCSIFRNSQYFELILSSFQKFTFDFSNFEFKTSSGEGVFTHFFITKQVTNLSLKSSLRNYSAVVTPSRRLELLYMIKVPSLSCNFQALAVAHL